LVSGGKATHLESVPVTESFQGQTVWDGVVEVFHLKGHPKTDKVYAWSHNTDDPERPKHHVTVLHVPRPYRQKQPSEPPSYRSLDALNQQDKPKKAGRPTLPKGEAKEATIRVRATADELEAYDRAAISSGQKRSDWIRSILNDASKPRAKFQTEVH